MDLFNVAYEVLLQIFERFFAHTDESDTQLKTLADATVGLMVRVIKPLGDLITTLPAGSDYPGQTAGPSFELFYESDYLLPHRDAAWALLAERLHVAAGFAQEIIIGDTGAGGPVLTPEQVAAGEGDPTPASEQVAAVVEPAPPWPVWPPRWPPSCRRPILTLPPRPARIPSAPPGPPTPI